MAGSDPRYWVLRVRHAMYENGVIARAAQAGDLLSVVFYPPLVVSETDLEERRGRRRGRTGLGRLAHPDAGRGACRPAGTVSAPSSTRAHTSTSSTRSRSASARASTRWARSSRLWRASPSSSRSASRRSARRSASSPRAAWSRSKRGVMGGVTVIKDDIPTSLLGLVPERRQTDVREILEARRAVEMELARLACRRADDDDFARDERVHLQARGARRRRAPHPAALRPPLPLRHGARRAQRPARLLPAPDAQAARDRPGPSTSSSSRIPTP